MIWSRIQKCLNRNEALIARLKSRKKVLKKEIEVAESFVEINQFEEELMKKSIITKGNRSSGWY